MAYTSIFQLLIATAFAIAGGLCVAKRRADLLLSLGIVSLGFGNFWIYALGSVWLPSKIVGTWSLAYVIVYSRESFGAIPISLRANFGFVIVATLIAFALGYLVPVANAYYQGGGTQGALLRPIIQLIGYLTALSFIPLAASASNRPHVIGRFYGYYAVAVIVVSIGGLVQYAYLRAGLQFMPIYRWNGNNSALAAFGVGREVVTRLYSLAGEPKSLGVFLTPFVVAGAVLSFEPRSAYPVWWNRRALFMCVGLIDVLTYSTAVLIALGVAVLISFALTTFRTGRGVAIVVVPLILLAALSQFWISHGGYSSPTARTGIEQVLYDRTAARIESDYQKRNETHALELLYSEPLYMVAGVGLGMYVYHLPDLAFGSGIEPIDSGWVVSLMDLGVIGTFALILLLFRALGMTLSQESASDQVRSTQLKVIACCIVAAGCMQLGTSSLTSLVIWCGVGIVGWRTREYLSGIRRADMVGSAQRVRANLPVAMKRFGRNGRSGVNGRRA